MPSLNTRLEVAKSIGMPLIELEKHLDAALVTTGAVLAAAVDGRRKARLPLHTGQAAIERLAGATAQLVTIRQAIHEAHLELRGIQDDMGLGVIAYGDHGDTPREVEERRPSGRLALASAA